MVACNDAGDSTSFLSRCRLQESNNVSTPAHGHTVVHLRPATHMCSPSLSVSQGSSRLMPVYAD